jgi:hypothetical protein
MARIGSNLGFSIAQGKNLGIQPTTLALNRGITDGFGQHRGYRSLIGADVTFRYAGIDWYAEAISFREPETGQSGPFSVYGMGFIFAPSAGGWQWRIDWSHIQGQESNQLLVALDAPRDGQLVYRPFFRMSGGQIIQAGFGVRVRF